MAKKTLLIVLLSMWTFFAVLSIGYNAVKTISEVKEWYFLTDSQKRHKIFGELYTFTVFVDKHTPPKASILMVLDDGFPFYLSRYYLYPKRVIWVDTPQNLSRYKDVSMGYIASYPFPVQTKDYTLVATMKNEKGVEKAFYWITICSNVYTII